MTDLDDAFFEIRWPEHRPFQVVGMGLNAVDWLCVLPGFPAHNSKMQLEEIHRLGGGQVATASALCGRYGLRVRYVGRVGDDETGEVSRQELEREPMELCMQTVPGAGSQIAIILVDRPTGERTILWDRDEALQYREGELRQEWITEGQLLHLDGHDQPAAIQAALWAREAGMKVSLDIDKVQPGVEELLKLTDFLLPSSDFVRQFSGSTNWEEALRSLSAISPGFVGMTMGESGAAALWEGQLVLFPGIQVDPVDTTGAGDVFHGAFIFGLFQGWSVGRCLSFANIAGAQCCTCYGARGGILPLGELLGILDS